MKLISFHHQTSYYFIKRKQLCREVHIPAEGIFKNILIILAADLLLYSKDMV